MVILLAGGTKKHQDADISAVKARWRDYKCRETARSDMMALAKDFKDTIQALAKRGPAFRKSLLHCCKKG